MTLRGQILVSRTDDDPCPQCVDSTRPRVYRHHAHILKHMYAWCPHTRRRFECTHGGVFESTHGFFHIFSACRNTHKHTHTKHTPRPPRPKRHTTQHNTQHHTETETGSRAYATVDSWDNVSSGLPTTHKMTPQQGQEQLGNECSVVQTAAGGSNTIPTRPHPESGRAHRARMISHSTQRATASQAGSSSMPAQ